MRHVFRYWRFCLAGMLVTATSVFAQAFELDLTEKAPPKPAEELRPTLAIVAVRTLEVDAVSKSRAAQIEAELIRLADESHDFRIVLAPAKVDQLLGSQSRQMSDCASFSCFDELARKLKVDRIATAAVSKAGPASIVTFTGFDAEMQELIVRNEDSGEKAERSFAGISGRPQTLKDRDFLRKMSPMLKENLARLNIPNGVLLIDNPDPSARVSINGVPAGPGSLSRVIRRGHHRVKVEADGFIPFEHEARVEPLTPTTVKVQLVARPIEIARAKQPPVAKQRPVYTRPGFFVAIAGLAAAGIGAGLMQSAITTQQKINQGGVPVSVTRSEAKAAAISSTAANVLFGIGGAALVGGVTWMIVTPTIRSSDNPATEPSEMTTPAVGATLLFGGSF